MRILEIIKESFPIAKKTFVDQGASPEAENILKDSDSWGPYKRHFGI